MINKELKYRMPSKHIVLLIVMSMLATLTTPMAAADVVGTEELVLQTQVDAKRAQIVDTLVRDDVRLKLQSMGVSPDDVQNRVHALTDAEVMQLADNIENTPAGGVFGTIIAILVIFILLDVAGATDIFPGV